MRAMSSPSYGGMDAAHRFHTVQLRDEQARFMGKITSLLLILVIASGVPAHFTHFPSGPMSSAGATHAFVELPRAPTAGRITAPRPVGVVAFVALATVIDLLVILSLVSCIFGA